MRKGFSNWGFRILRVPWCCAHARSACERRFGGLVGRRAPDAYELGSGLVEERGGNPAGARPPPRIPSLVVAICWLVATAASL